MSKARKMKNTLNSAISDVITNASKYLSSSSKDFTRNRKLPLESVIKRVMSMSGQSLQKEMASFACENGTLASASAFSQQRDKINPRLFAEIFRHYNSLCYDKNTYNGYRLYAVDGSDINVARNPDAESYIQNSGHPNGINQVHLNAIYDVMNKTYRDVEIQPGPQRNEYGALYRMLGRNKFAHKSILLADRGYEAFNVFIGINKTENLDYLMRIKGGKGAIKEVAALPKMELDRDVPIILSDKQTKEAREKGWHYFAVSSNTSKLIFPYAFSLRIIRIELDNGEFETIATSLRRDEFPLEEIKALYHLRWGIETSFRELKYDVGLINLHSKKEALVLQEIYAGLIMYNFCSRIAASVEVCTHNASKWGYQVNFSVVIHICKKFYRNDKLNTDIEELINKYILPIRPDRQDERKLRPKGFVGFMYRVA